MKKSEVDFSKQCSKEKLQEIMLNILQKIDEVCQKHQLRYFITDGTLLGAIRHKGFIPWDDDIDIGMPRQDYEAFRAIAQDEFGEDYFLQTMETDPGYHNYYIPMKVRDNHSTFLEQYGRNCHEGVYVDVFPFDPVTENREKEEKQKKNLYLLSVIKGPIQWSMFPSPYFWGRSLFQILLRWIPQQAILRYIEKAKEENQSHKPGGAYMYGFETPWRTQFPESDLFPLTKVEFAGRSFFAPHNPEAILTKLYGDYKKLPPEKDRQYHAVFYTDERLF